jgi:hypothetical protein
MLFARVWHFSAVSAFFPLFSSVAEMMTLHFSFNCLHRICVEIKSVEHFEHFKSARRKLRDFAFLHIN